MKHNTCYREKIDQYNLPDQKARTSVYKIWWVILLNKKDLIIIWLNNNV